MLLLAPVCEALMDMERTAISTFNTMAPNRLTRSPGGEAAGVKREVSQATREKLRQAAMRQWAPVNERRAPT